MRARHRSNSPSTSTIIPDLERLQCTATLIRNALQQRGTDAVCRHVTVGIVLYLLALT